MGKVDLPQNLEVITVIGLPYDDPLFHNPYLRELFRYLKFHSVNVRKLLYDYRALPKTVQSFRRGIRNINQRLKDDQCYLFNKYCYHML